MLTTFPMGRKKDVTGHMIIVALLTFDVMIK
jgi:hypothetical protein